MVYNLRFDRLKKQKSENEIEGFVLVTFSDLGKTKVISTKRVVTRTHFDRYFNKDFKKFIPTTVIDSKGLNAIIDEIILTQNPFKPISTCGFIAYCKQELKYQLKQNTYISYQYVIKSFEDYLSIIDKKDIAFDDLKISVFRDYKLFLDTKANISNGTIKHNFIVLKCFINKANDDGLCDLNLPLRKFGLVDNAKRPTVLSDKDIKILLDVEKNNLRYEYVQFSLFQLFGNGLRFSDCLFIKLSDFKDNYLEIRTMKVKTVLQIEYTPLLIDILYNILKCDYVPHVHPYNKYVNQQLKNIDHDFINVPKRDYILEHIKKKPDRFLFRFAPPILFTVNKAKALGKEEHRHYINTRTHFNNQLIQIRKLFDLSVTTFTSHSMRYAYTRIAIQKDIPIHLLSKSLGHASIGITERYIRETFGVDDFSPIGKMMKDFKPNFGTDDNTAPIK